MSDVLIRAINDLQARCSQFEKIVRTINEKLDLKLKDFLPSQEFVEKIEEIKKNDVSSLEEHKKNIEEYKSYLSNFLEGLQLKLNRLSDFSNVHENTLFQQAKINQEIQERLNLYYETVNKNLAHVYEAIHQEIINAIEAIPKPKIPKIEEISSLIDQKIEPLSLDAKNGLLRSANCDLRLSIVEKKIDQIFLLLQKHSLNQ